MVGASHHTQNEPDHLKSQELVLATTHKFGIRLPKTTEEALQIDKITGNDFWRKAINKEMSKVKIAWKVNDGHTPSEARAATATEFV